MEVNNTPSFIGYITEADRVDCSTHYPTNSRNPTLKGTWLNHSVLAGCTRWKSWRGFSTTDVVKPEQQKTERNHSLSEATEIMIGIRLF